MTQYKDPTQPPNTPQRATSEQNKVIPWIGEMIQTIAIAVLIIFTLTVITHCQPVEAKQETKINIGNKNNEK